MPWQVWVILALFAVNALAVVLKVGAPRKPLTSGDAVAVLVTNGLLAWLLVSAVTA